MIRTTISQLQNMVDRLNSVSKCRYTLEQSYGRTRVIVKYPNSAGCIGNVTYNLPKGELESVLNGILEYLSKESREDLHIKKCEHIDKLNGKPYKSVIHEYDGKKYCSACGEIKA